MPLSLDELRAQEAQLRKAIANPTSEVQYDTFRKKTRSMPELMGALNSVMAQINDLQHAAGVSRPKPRFYVGRHRDGF